MSDQSERIVKKLWIYCESHFLTEEISDELKRHAEPDEVVELPARGAGADPKREERSSVSTRGCGETPAWEHDARSPTMR